jgi:hypothetical protein
VFLGLKGERWMDEDDYEMWKEKQNKTKMMDKP